MHRYSALLRTNGRSDRRAAGSTDGAICVQRLDDSLNSAIHTTYRSSRRSSSKHEPRGPPLEVVYPLSHTRSPRAPTEFHQNGKKKTNPQRAAGFGETHGTTRGKGRKEDRPPFLRRPTGERRTSDFNGLLSIAEPSPTPSLPPRHQKILSGLLGPPEAALRCTGGARSESGHDR